MRLLLDTHTLLWCLKNDLTLSKEARLAIENRDNQVFVSTISIVEIRIKQNLGKLRNIPDNLENILYQVPFEILDFTIKQAFAVGDLPFVHRDPFDWMLMAQARIEGLTLVTRDRDIRQYNIPTLPA